MAWSLRNLIPGEASKPKAWGAEFVRLSTTFDQEVNKIILDRLRPDPRDRPWRRATVREALGVPAISRAVELIASTTGMLSVQGFRNGVAMDDPPRLIVRPDPNASPGVFYAGTAANRAKYGEFVWWIGSRDNDGLASALILVPLLELQVDANPKNRLRPKYRWGDKESTRWSPANPEGDFVHYIDPLSEPFSLRGAGPLQRCGAATSVTVEAQAWAANFYARGGFPREWIKTVHNLDPTRRDDFGNPDDENGLSEADRLRAQYTTRDNNTPLVSDTAIDDIRPLNVNPQGAQMLDARNHQNGEAARMFGIPGSLLEYQQPGSSLTYQNLEGEFSKFVKVCLQPNYLEPIEQAMSDLLTRTTTARFNVKGFLRADIKTRFEVHGIAIDKQIYGPEYAAREEGILPGDVEYAPVPFAPPQALPSPISRAASLLSQEVRCPNGHLLAELTTAPYRFTCPKPNCKLVVESSAMVA